MASDNIRAMSWDDVADSISDPIMVIDNNNNIVRANLSFAKLMNKRMEDIVGKKCYKIVHNTDEPVSSCPFEKSKNDHKTHTDEVIDPNVGIPILVTTSPIFDKKGDMIGVVHIIKNIADLKKTEAELTKKIEELSRFQKITVDRELRMKELKEKIRQLESKLGNA
jgi:PAS domain S-box-containing protein